jgi:cobalamin-dependent methionine synthase I
VGDRFGSGALILPFVLQSAEVIEKAQTHTWNKIGKTSRLE